MAVASNSKELRTATEPTLARVRLECEGCGHISGWLENPRVGAQYVMCAYCEWPIVAALTVAQMDKALRASVTLLGQRVPQGFTQPDKVD